jgi:hypothetical protein
MLEVTRENIFQECQRYFDETGEKPTRHKIKKAFSKPESPRIGYWCTEWKSVNREQLAQKTGSVYTWKKIAEERETIIQDLRFQIQELLKKYEIVEASMSNTAVLAQQISESISGEKESD